MPRKIKTKIEIQKEIALTRNHIAKLRTQKDSYADKEAYNYKFIDYEATIDALMWVLGENDRYD